MSLTQVNSVSFNPETDQMIRGADGAPTAFRRKIVRMVKKPFPKTKKVPVTTKKVVATEIEQKVKGTRLVAVPDFEEVEETYTEYVEEEVEVPVKKWVEETVTEDYIEKVPVQKTRTVQKLVTKIEEVEDYELVRVPGTKVIEVDGWRVDEIEDRKLVEVEEYEVYEFLPQTTGKVVRGNVRDVGTKATAVVRKTGGLVYAKADLANCGVDFDAIEADETVKKAVECSEPLWGPELFSEEMSPEEYEQLTGKKAGDGRSAPPPSKEGGRRRRQGGNNESRF